MASRRRVYPGQEQPAANATTPYAAQPGVANNVQPQFLGSPTPQSHQQHAATQGPLQPVQPIQSGQYIPPVQQQWNPQSHQAPPQTPPLQSHAAPDANSGETMRAQHGRRVYPQDAAFEQMEGQAPTMGGLNLNDRPGSYSPTPQQHAQTQQSQHPQANQGEVAPTALNQCPSKYQRMTISALPATNNLLLKSSIPFGCVMHPFAPQDHEDRVPIVNFGGSGIVRCRRCRTYINPFVTFADGGRRWKCNLCEVTNDVPAEYFAHVDPATGQRSDVRDRPELARGCIEFVAPSEYMVRPPQPPVYYFLIDVCYASLASGMLNTVIQAVRSTLNELLVDPRTQIGFLTFDKTLHFYNLKSSLSQAQMMVVTDLSEIFVPTQVDDLVVNLRESKDLIESLLEKMPNMFKETQHVESAVGPALKSAFEVIKHVGGKLLVFQSTMPITGEGKLVIREDPKILGTDKENTILVPSDAAQFYKDFALDCSRQQIAIDLYICTSTYIDIATFGVLPQITGGELYYYPGYRSDKDGENLASDIHRDLTRYTAFEAVMRIRCSRGLKTVAHHGNFFIRSSDLLALPNLDEDKGFAIQLQITENLSAVRYGYIQTAVLYTTSSGERRIRVMTTCIPVTSNIADLFRFADEGAVINLLGKMAVDKIQTAKLSDAREALVNKCIEILVAYRDSVASQQNSAAAAGTQLLIPETMRHLPLYVLALAKNVMFRPADVRPDERSFHLYRFKTLPVNASIEWLYPRFYNVNAPETVVSVDANGKLLLPLTMNLSSEKLNRQHVFLLDNGYTMYLYVAKSVAPEILRNLFNVNGFNELQAGPIRLPRLENELSHKLRSLVDAIASVRINHRYQFPRIELVREGDMFNISNTLIEDRTQNITSYYDFLMQLQRSVSAKPVSK